jgi:LCP family protein required for cell wall assembly
VKKLLTIAIKLTTLILLLITVINFIPGADKERIVKNINEPKLDENQVSTVEGQRASDNDKLNIMVVGADAEYKQQNRADTLMVVSLDLTTKQVGVLSIPRDTRVIIPEDGKHHKINAAYARGGLELTKQVIEEQFGIPIDNYLQVDYQGFIQVVDALGGVEVKVEEDLFYRDQAADLEINLAAGQQILTGSQSLNYVRYRGGLTGDIGRIKRQQKFIKAAAAEILAVKNLFKLPGLITRARGEIKTDLKLPTMLKLAARLNNLDLAQVEMELVPGEPKYINRISYWIPDIEKTQEVIDSLLVTREAT